MNAMPASKIGKCLCGKLALVELCDILVGWFIAGFLKTP